jgi:hypothetical protein
MGLLLAAVTTCPVITAFIGSNRRSVQGAGGPGRFCCAPPATSWAAAVIATIRMAIRFTRGFYTPTGVSLSRRRR